MLHMHMQHKLHPCYLCLCGGPGIIKTISDQVNQMKASQGKSKSEKIPEQRVAMVYNDATAFTLSTMDSAQSYAMSLGLTPIVTSYNGTAYPSGRILPYLLDVQQQGIKWLLVMSQDPDGLDAAKEIRDNNLDVWVKWVTTAPSGRLFVPTMGQRGAEFFIVSGLVV